MKEVGLELYATSTLEGLQFYQSAARRHDAAASTSRTPFCTSALNPVSSGLFHPDSPQSASPYLGYQILEERGRGGLGIVYRADEADKSLLIYSGATSDASSRLLTGEKDTMAQPGINFVILLLDSGVSRTSNGPWSFTEV